MASSQVVSLRLSLDEIEYLEQQQLEGESLSATIKRLVLGESVKQPNSNIPDQNQIDQLKEDIKQELHTAFEALIQPLRDALIEDREKLERLANTVNDLSESLTVTNTVNSVNTVNIQQQFNAFEKMTKAELQRILDESGIRYSSKTSKAELIELCLTRNFG